VGLSRLPTLPAALFGAMPALVRNATAAVAAMCLTALGGALEARRHSHGWARGCGARRGRRATSELPASIAVALVLSIQRQVAATRECTRHRCPADRSAALVRVRHWKLPSAQELCERQRDPIRLLLLVVRRADVSWQLPSAAMVVDRNSRALTRPSIWVVDGATMAARGTAQ
jgi:hypothetical protein